METNNLKKRIENINHYIGLASKLDKIVEDSEVSEEISSIIQTLEDIRKLYSSKLEQKQIGIRSMVKKNQLIGELANLSYGGDFKKAKDSLDDLGLNLRKYFFSYLRKTCNSAFLCVITAPFSREVSKTHYNIFKCYKNAARSLKKAIDSGKIEQKINKIKIKNMAKRADILHDAEFVEAKLADKLTEWGLEEKSTSYIAREQKEIYVFICLESLKEQYGKGIV